MPKSNIVINTVSIGVNERVIRYIDALVAVDGDTTDKTQQLADMLMVAALATVSTHTDTQDARKIFDAALMVAVSNA